MRQVSIMEEIWHDEGNIKDQTVHFKTLLICSSATNSVCPKWHFKTALRAEDRQGSPMEGSSPTRQVSRKGLVGGLHPSE